MSSYDEATFESAIEIYLSEHDKYIKRDHSQFDRKRVVSNNGPLLINPHLASPRGRGKRIEILHSTFFERWKVIREL